MKNEDPFQVPVAIIGIGCMFAKSADQKSFLRLLMRGVDAITDPPETHHYLNDYFDADPKKPDHIYCNRGGYLPLVDFDPSEFGIPPTALEATDTSQLLGLVVAKQALDDAGYGNNNGRTFDRERASVILGVTGTQELVIPLGARLGHPLWRRALADAGVTETTADDVIQRIAEGYVSWQESSFPGLLGNVVAGRIANRLDLGGTNCVVDAACASSMSAIHLALMELATGRSDMAITGGVDTISDAFMHMCFSRTQILSKSGNIRPFSKNADGTVLGEGVGMLVLKRLDDAQRDGDRIYAVIKGLGTSSDGKSQSIYAPRQSGQVAALRRAFQSASIAPDNIGLVEAHGTGTRVGDQVEFKALCEAFGSVASKGDRCALGSVKSNIGHTKAAAGTAGLIKAAFCLYHKVLIPTLKADPPDPNLDVANSPFYINQDLKPWIPENGGVRRAGVSAFGFGGSNFHAILEEFDPHKKEPSWDGSVEIAAFSGQSEESLTQMVEEWRANVAQNSEENKVGRWAAQSRMRFDSKDPYRLVMVFDSANDRTHVMQRCDAAKEKLATWDNHARPAADGIFIGFGDPPGKLGFLFPGQGSQYVGMVRDLICCFPEAIQVLQEAEAAMNSKIRLSDSIYPKLLDDPAEAENRLRRTDIAQPAIGAISAAMLAALNTFGIAPDGTCGHSYGELVALYAAGRLDREALWQLSEARGRLMAEAGNQAKNADPGSMLAVRGPITELDHLVAELPEGVVLANRNSPEQGVLSGPAAAIEAAEKICKTKGYQTIRLPVAAAFHSKLVSDAQTPFQKIVDQVHLRSGSSIAVMSNSLGGAYPDAIDQAKKVLGRQLALPVDFIANVEHLYADGVRTFVEVGPKAVLTRLVEKILDGRFFHAMALDRSGGRANGVGDLAHSLARLAALGYPVLLQRWEIPLPEPTPKRMRIPLSGANYITPRPARAPVTRREKRDDTDRKVEPATSSHNVKTVPKEPVPAPTRPEPLRQRAIDMPNGRQKKIKHEIKTMDPSKRDYLSHALTTVQQGLASMQALQSQTSETHQKYLEAQAEASRTLQQMLRSTQQLVDAGMGGFTAGNYDHDNVTVPAMQPPKNAPSISLSSPNPSTPTIVDQSQAVPDASVKPASRQDDDKAPVNTESHSSGQLEAIQKALVAIVSQLTGYPDDMLAMDMDIESDLGIDSIKRVEILSALEEQMPDLPRVTPDMMGSLKTLGQICDYLGSGVSRTPQFQASVNSPTPAAQPMTTTKGGDQSAVQTALLKVVAALTGYPEEMLGLDMDIESDLGIDSIKRVEILSAMEDQMPNLPRVTPDMVGALKTLGQICQYLCGTGSADASPLSGSSSSDDRPASNPIQPKASDRSKVEEDATESVPRYRIDVIDLPSNPKLRGAHPIRSGAPFAIGLAARQGEFGDALEKAMTSAGWSVLRLTEHSKITTEIRLAGLVISAPQEPSDAFRWAQICHPALQEAVKAGCDAFFCTVSRLDGAFGFAQKSLSDPEQGALAGLVKTAAIEWPEIHCLALDVDPQWHDIGAAAGAVIEEVVFRNPADGIEIGLGPKRRIGLQLVAETPVSGTTINLDRDDVVVVSGGARGVTAAAATALAMETPCRLVLLGRSPQPTREPEWLQGISEEPAIKKAILAHSTAGKALAPRELEKIYRQWMANREVLSTVERLRGLGIDVLYFSVDVCDAKAVRDVMSKLRREHGPIRAIIHGAGILEDRLIVDKKINQFSVVYDTKVKGLNTLLEATENDELKYLALFSSISARMGNTGQADYAMANEALNKIALQQAHQRPGCKVLAINWGPWDGGMVTPSLKRVFEDAGISLIPVEAGARAMVAEMGQPLDASVEIVIGGPLPSALRQPDDGQDAMATCKADGSMSLAAKRDIDLHRYPILEAHRLDGRPVVPFALITEWLAHGALHANPGLCLYGIDNLRLFKGIVLDGHSRSIRLMAAAAKRQDGMYAVDVEVRDGQQNGSCQIHSSATALLADHFPAPPSFEENGHFKATAYQRSLGEIYEHILFHGDALRGIEKIIHFSDKGLTARVRSAPAPHQWLQDPMRSRWIADPLVMDCAFQMAIIWCYEHQQLVSLPSYAAAYRQYRERFPSQGVTAVMEVVRTTDRKLTADFTFLDEDKKVIGCMTGYEAVMDQNLFKVFGVKAA